MTQILYEDYPNRRIYLHPDTVTQGVDPAALHREHRSRRALNANNERNYLPMVTFRGNESKGGGTFTPRLTNLRSLVRLVPSDTHHILKIKNEIVCLDDGIANQSCFDRLNVLSNVDIDIDFNPTEVLTVNTGSGLTPEQSQAIAGMQQMVSQLWTIKGFDPASPVTISDDSITVGNTTITITQTQNNTVLSTQ